MFTEKYLERWETKLLTVFKPMVTEVEVDKGKLLLVTLYVLLQLRFSSISMYYFYCLKYLDLKSNKMNHNFKEIQIEKCDNFP